MAVTMVDEPLAIRGQTMSAAASRWEMLGEKLLRIDIQGIVSAEEAVSFQKILQIIMSHKCGIVIICVDGLRKLDIMAVDIIRMIARVASMNLNATHIVVGELSWPVRANFSAFRHLACLHESYGSFLERNSQ